MPSSPPANAGFMVAAYLLVGVVILGYFVSLLRRARR